MKIQKTKKQIFKKTINKKQILIYCKYLDQRVAKITKIKMKSNQITLVNRKKGLKEVSEAKEIFHLLINLILMMMYLLWTLNNNNKIIIEEDKIEADNN